jgi:hypothetical protein
MLPWSELNYSEETSGEGSAGTYLGVLVPGLVMTPIGALSSLLLWQQAFGYRRPHPLRDFGGRLLGVDRFRRRRSLASDKKGLQGYGTKGPSPRRRSRACRP